MLKKTATLYWILFEEEGYWRYGFGNERNMAYSGRLMSKELAQKVLNDEIEQAKIQYGEGWEVLLKEVK